MKKALFSTIFLAILLLGNTMAHAQYLPKTDKGTAFAEPVMSLSIATGEADMSSYMKTVFADFKDMNVITGGVGFRTGYFPLNKLETYVQISGNIGGDMKSSKDVISDVHNWGVYVGVEYFFGNIKDLVTFSANIGIGSELIRYSYDNLNTVNANGVLDFGLTVWLTRMGFNVSYTPAIVKGSTKSSTGFENVPEMSLNNVNIGLRFRF